MGVRVDGIDEAWLARASARDPVRHAYAVWDLEHEPDRIRFTSVREGEETVAYLLAWHGPLHPPMLHWVGSPNARELLDGWPERPFVAVVPPPLVEELRRRRGPAPTYATEVLVRAGPEATLRPGDRPARRLTPADAEAVARFAAEERHRLVEGYRNLDLARGAVYGAFDGARLAAVARASVVLPKVWLLTGILSAERRRGEGFGRAVAEAATRDALRAGAVAALYVRSDNRPATELYRSLGYRLEERKVWVDSGAAWEP